MLERYAVRNLQLDKDSIGVYPAVGTKPLLRDKCLVCNAGTTHSMLQNGIFMVIFILFFSIFLAACGIGNIWCQLLGKRLVSYKESPINHLYLIRWRYTGYIGK